MTKSLAVGMGLPVDETLPNTAVLGFILEPQYDNSGSFAEQYIMYAFNKEIYDAEINKVSKDNPLEEMEEMCIRDRICTKWQKQTKHLLITVSNQTAGAGFLKKCA